MGEAKRNPTNKNICLDNSAIKVQFIEASVDMKNQTRLLKIKNRRLGEAKRNPTNKNYLDNSAIKVQFIEAIRL